MILSIEDLLCLRSSRAVVNVSRLTVDEGEVVGILGLQWSR